MNSALNVVVRPPQSDFLQNRLFRSDFLLGSHWMAPMVHLKEAADRKGWRFNTWDMQPLDEADVVLIQDLPRRKEFDDAKRRAPQAKFILQIWETPLSRPLIWNKQNHSLFDGILTYDAKLADGKRYFHYWLPVNEPPDDLVDPSFAARHPMVLVNNNRRSGILASRQRGLAGIQFFGPLFSGWHVTPAEVFGQDVGQQYSHRRHIARLAETEFPGLLHLYGAGWQGDEISWFHRFFPSHVYAGTQGPTVGDKLPYLTKYRFVLAFENVVADRGYVSEKIFDAIYAGCVPIYLGDERISDLVPADCFVDARQFKGDDRKLLQFVVSCDEATWQRYRDAGRRFLNSPAVKVVQSPAFVESVMNAIQTVANQGQRQPEMSIHS